MFYSKLLPSHDTSSFDCGNTELNSFLHNHAMSFMKRKLCLVHVLMDENIILGFYTLSPFTVDINTFPAKTARKYPKTMPLPCWLLGKLAVDKRYQKRGLGRELLMTACERAAKLSNEDAGGFCIIVDAKDGKAKDFYIKYGFMAFKDAPLRLYLPLPRE